MLEKEGLKQPEPAHGYQEQECPRHYRLRAGLRLSFPGRGSAAAYKLRRQTEFVGLRKETYAEHPIE